MFENKYRMNESKYRNRVFVRRMSATRLFSQCSIEHLLVVYVGENTHLFLSDRRLGEASFWMNSVTVGLTVKPTINPTLGENTDLSTHRRPSNLQLRNEREKITVNRKE